MSANLQYVGGLEMLRSKKAERAYRFNLHTICADSRSSKAVV
jgi:hypothetical protein